MSWLKVIPSNSTPHVCSWPSLEDLAKEDAGENSLWACDNCGLVWILRREQLNNIVEWHWETSVNKELTLDMVVNMLRGETNVHNIQKS